MRHNIQGSRTITRRPKDGDKGNDGSQGAFSIQKDWIIGDTHHNTSEVVDFIYVRGDSGATSYWYKKVTLGTNVASTPPQGGVTPYTIGGVTYEKVSWLDTLAVKTFIAEGGNLGGLIFKNNRLISQRGTVNGQTSSDFNNPNFVPNILIDGNTGYAEFANAKIRGEIQATSGKIGGLTIEDGKLLVGDVGGNRIELDPYDRRIRLINNADQLMGQIVFASGDTNRSVGAIIELNYLHQNVRRSSIRLGGFSSDVTIRTYNTSGVEVGETNYRHDGMYIDGQKVDMGGGSSGYVLPTATQTTLGGVKVGTNLSISNGVLSATNTKYNVATTSANGLMSSSDKSKLNSIAASANNYVHPSTHPASMITAGTLQGIVKANNNTSYTTKQVRNMILSTGNAVASSMENGDIWIKYE